MNREIKFRVWDKYKKQMYPISSIDYDIFSQEIRIIAVGHRNGMCTSYNKNHNSEKCDITALELMQYTGLHDKNGKEIYEGDIVVDKEDEVMGEITWNEEEASFYFSILYENGTYEEEKLNDWASVLEVIGNIYDNPELLGGEDESTR